MASSRRGAGRKSPDKKDLTAIKKRLRKHLGDTKREETDFAIRIGVSPETVANWLDPRETTVPDPRPLLKIGRKEMVSIDWLLLGRGSRIWQEPLSENPSIGDELRTHLANHLDGEHIHPKIVNSIVPEGGQLLYDVTAHYLELGQRAQQLPGGLGLIIDDPNTEKELEDTRFVLAERIEDSKQQLLVIDLLLERAYLQRTA